MQVAWELYSPCHGLPLCHLQIVATSQSTVPEVPQQLEPEFSLLSVGLTNAHLPGTKFSKLQCATSSDEFYEVPC